MLEIVLPITWGNSLSLFIPKYMSNLQLFTCRCGTGLYPFRNTLCELFLSQLTWTQAILTRSTEREDQFVSSRAHMYNAMSEIMRQPGLHELFSAAGDKLVEHVLSDIQRKKKQVWDLLTITHLSLGCHEILHCS